MVYREVHRVELREILRRWQAGEGVRAIARATGFARNTVGKYLAAAEELGLTVSGPPATDDQVTRLLALGYTGPAHDNLGPSKAILVPHRDQIESWLTKEHLKLTRIQELLEGRGCIVPYTSLRRFIANEQLRPSASSTVRVAEGKPGQFAEMDFERLGYHLDPTTGRKLAVHALLVVLCFSRHMFLWPMLHQRLEDVIEGLEATWRFFDGVPRHVILDNFPAAVAQPDPISPRLTKGFLDYAQFRGFLPDPARVRHPRDKPHVERMVPYARERFFKGSSFADLDEMRRKAQEWCREVAGSRIHGTTHQMPFPLFLKEEQPQLLPLGAMIYQVPQYANLHVHPDHHVEFASALYSLPWNQCPPGSGVEVRGDADLVRIYHKGSLVKIHPRQSRGGRSTDPADYPPEKSAYAMRSSEELCRKAAEFGPSIGEFATRLLSGDLPWTKMRQAQKLLRLADRYTPIRLDAACCRALSFELIDVTRLERILIAALDQEDQPQADGNAEYSAEEPSTLPSRFARPGSAFARPVSYPAATIPPTSGGSRP